MPFHYCEFLTHLLQLCHIYYILGFLGFFFFLENFPKVIILVVSHFYSVILVK